MKSILFCCLFICRDRNKEKIAHQFFLSVTKLGVCSEPRKISVCERQIDLKLQTPERFFPRVKYKELSIKKLE